MILMTSQSDKYYEGVEEEPEADDLEFANYFDESQVCHLNCHSDFLFALPSFLI